MKTQSFVVENLLKTLVLAFLLLGTVGLVPAWTLAAKLVQKNPELSSDTIAVGSSEGNWVGSLAFIRNDEGGLSKWMRRICLMNPDGSGRMQATKEMQGWDVAWSPEGSRIAFTCPLDGNLEMCLVNADGSHLTRLTRDAATDQSPTWSPDGSHIAFASNRGGTFQIYVMTATGLGAVPLTHTTTNEMQPQWSPDGRFIAFVSDRILKKNAMVNRDIFVMSVDGSDIVSLTSREPACLRESPAWSPDGSQIAFAADCDVLRLQIYVMNADGNGQTRLTTSAGHDRNPTWSPDGKQIAFDSTRDLPSADLALQENRTQIYVINADGTGQVRLTSDDREFSGHPSWNWSVRYLY